MAALAGNSEGRLASTRSDRRCCPDSDTSDAFRAATGGGDAVTGGDAARRAAEGCAPMDAWLFRLLCLHPTATTYTAVYLGTILQYFVTAVHQEVK